MLESLPAATREQYGTPKPLVAFLAINDVPLGAAQVIAWNEIKTPASTVQVQLQRSGPEGNTKDLILRFSSQSADWRLVVAEGVIGKYSAMLKGPPVAAGEIR